MAIISKEQVYPRISEVFQNSNDNTVTTDQLKTWLNESFGANENQISGLIHRMHSKDHVLEKVKDVRGVYRLAKSNNHAQENTNECDISEFMIDEVNRTIKKIEEKVASNLTSISQNEFSDIKQSILELNEIKRRFQSV